MGRTTKTVLRWVRLPIYVVLAIALLLGPLPGALEAIFCDYAGDLDQPISDRAYAHYSYIKSHLARPFHGYGKWEVLVPQFSVVALSHMACGLMNLAISRPEMRGELAPLIEEVVARATSHHVSPWGSDPREVSDLDDQGLYLSHLNLILGCYRHVTGRSDQDALHTRVSEHLASRSVRDPDFHAASYPGQYKWPADQTVTLCSLYLYDRTHGTRLSEEPINGWLHYMREIGTDKATGLHHSSVSPFWYRETPRGCALSWSVLYMAQFAPEEAGELYRLYRSRYFKTVCGNGGFREWPPGQDHSGDVDSGPIVFGMGAAASGLAVGPARIFRDPEAYASLLRSASLTMPTPWFPTRRHLFLPILGEAILFNGETATIWFERPSVHQIERVRHFPTAPAILAGVSLGLALLLAGRVKKLVTLLRAGKTPRSR